MSCSSTPDGTNFTRASGSAITQDSQKSSYTLLNHLLAGNGDLFKCTPERFDQMQPVYRDRLDRSLATLMRRKAYTSRDRTVEQAELDRDDPYSLMNFQLAEVGKMSRWSQETFETHKTDPNQSKAWEKNVTNLNTIMRKNGILPTPARPQQTDLEEFTTDGAAGVPTTQGSTYASPCSEAGKEPKPEQSPSFQDRDVDSGASSAEVKTATSTYDHSREPPKLAEDWTSTSRAPYPIASLDSTISK